MPNISLFLISALASLIAGNAICSYGMVILSYNLTENGAITGLVFAGNFLPIVALVGVLNRVIARLGARAVLRLGLTVHALSVALLCMAWQQGLLDNWPIPILGLSAVANGICLAFTQSARVAMVTETVQESRAADLQQLLSLIIILSFAVAPLFMEGAIVLLGWTGALAMISILLASATIPLRALEPVQVFRHNGPHQNVRLSLSLKELLLFAFLALTLMGPVQSVLPLHARTMFPDALITRPGVEAFFGFGLLSGGVLARRIGKSHSLSFYLFTFSGFAAIFQFVLIATASRTGFLFICLMLGICAGASFALLNSVLQQESRPHEKTAMSVRYTLVFQLAPALAGLGTGFLFEHANFAAAFSASGIAMALATALALRFHIAQHEQRREDFRESEDIA